MSNEAPEVAADATVGAPLPEYVQRNREHWDASADEWVASGRQNWESEPSWGIWNIPESELRLLPDLEGRDAIELGCGTAYVSAWMARRGAQVTAIDNSAAQLRSARTLQDAHGLHFPLLHGNAETVPRPDRSFDFAISEYGASLWCDPYVWIPEAARLLRPGGQLSFLTQSPALVICLPETDEPATAQLLRPWFGMHRFEWPLLDRSVEFHLNHGDMLRLLRSAGFEVLDLIDLRPPEGAATRFPYAPLEWARRWPTEEVWVARRLG